jgi:hypothetical protein
MLDTIPVVAMDKGEAARMLRLYNENLKGRLTNADRLMKKAYRELAKGRRLINLVDAFRVTGLDERGRPRLAIARADWPRVFYDLRWRGRAGGYFLSFSGSQRYWNEAVFIPRAAVGDGAVRSSITAAVPIIPPQFRPADELHRYHILYEAAWEELPPVDPFLLRIIRWPLCVILAQWDLTPVERMVFSIR